MAFKRNVGDLDRMFRIGISLLMLYFGLLDSTALTPFVAQLLVGAGVLNLVASLAGYCPLYALAALDTTEAPPGP